jgi:hypothetical protein
MKYRETFYDGLYKIVYVLPDKIWGEVLMRDLADSLENAKKVVALRKSEGAYKIEIIAPDN